MDGWMDGWMGGWVGGWVGVAETFSDGYKKRCRMYRSNNIYSFYLSCILDISPTPTTASPGMSSTAVQGQCSDWNWKFRVISLGFKFNYRIQ